MARGRKEGTLYLTQAKLCKGEVNVASTDMEIWHRRLGHMSEKGIHILARKQFLPDMTGNSIQSRGLVRKEGFLQTSEGVRVQSVRSHS